jgi:preprotein translocase subunit SecA
MEDDLMRIFGSDKMRKRMEFLGLPDDEAIESRMLSKAIESAQKKVEGHNFDIRKHLLEYDDVLNKHRGVIYKKRRDILAMAAQATTEGERPTKALVMQAVEREMEHIVFSRTPEEGEWDVKGMAQAAGAILPSGAKLDGRLEAPKADAEGRLDLVTARTAYVEALMAAAREAYAAIEAKIGDGVQMMDLERTVLLRSIDMLWVDHLEAIDHLRKGIGLQGYGQRDPLVEYKKQAYFLFQEMLAAIDRQVASVIFRVQVSYDIVRQAAPELVAQHPSSASSGVVGAGAANGLAVQVLGKELPKDAKEPGRNDMCPCGSGKKFKKCHGAI